jgi:hypothetical protein
MSDFSYSKQTPWEETPEEVRRRIKQSQATKTSWFGTIVGLMLAVGALTMLLAAS